MMICSIVKPLQKTQFEVLNLRCVIAFEMLEIIIRFRFELFMFIKMKIRKAAKAISLLCASGII